MKKDFIYLASASPRRGELLRQIGVQFEARAAAIAEVQADGEAPDAYVRRLAAEKAAAVWARVAPAERRPVLGADTAVVLGLRVLGKPVDAAEAETLLAESEVRFRATTAEERAAYCRSGEPLDKAGGYAIQGRAAMFVEHLSGSYSGVMGLPL